MVRDKVYSSKVREFESMLQEHFQANYLCTISNATSGILGTFYALGLRNSEIITTPLTWAGAITPLKMLGNEIVFAEIEEPTLTLNPDKLEHFITPNTKAIFSADFLGYPCRLDEIRSICDKHRILLIHDAASSFGSQYKKKYSGYFAHVSIFSFGRNKPFTTGEGGCLITATKELFNRIGKTILHLERQDIQLGIENKFFINTSINPLAVDYGIKTFHEQLIIIRSNIKTIEENLSSQMNLNLSADIRPNYHKLLFKVNGNLDWHSSLFHLPFSPLAAKFGISNHSLMKYRLLKCLSSRETSEMADVLESYR